VLLAALSLTPWPYASLSARAGVQNYTMQAIGMQTPRSHKGLSIPLCESAFWTSADAISIDKSRSVFYSAMPLRTMIYSGFI